MAVAKVILNGSTLMDATVATASASDITSPKTAMLANGVMTTGTGSGGGGGSLHTATFLSNISSSAFYIYYNGVTYNYSNVSAGSTFTFTAGNVMSIYSGSGRVTGGDIYIDGVMVATGGSGPATYNYTLPDHDVEIEFTLGSAATVFITFPEISITTNGKHVVNDYYYANVMVEGTAGADEIIQRNIAGTYENSTVQSVGSCAFAYCTSLSAISLQTATKIGYYAFSSCTNLSVINAPLVSALESGAFCRCTNLSSANFSLVSVIPSSAFFSCTGLISVSFPSATSIGQNAFAYCTKLANIHFSSAISSIGVQAFYHCQSLISVEFTSINSIAASVFQGCSGLTAASFLSVSMIGTGGFAECPNLSMVYMPSLRSVGMSAFYRTGLTEVSFSMLSYISNSAFALCSSLISVSLNSVTSTSGHAFASCSNLSFVSMPNLKYIGANTFIGCHQLSVVSFPNLSYIAASAFYGCRNLVNVYLLGSRVVGLGMSTAFYNTPLGPGNAHTGEVYGSIFVPASLYSTYISSTTWTLISSYIVSLTDAQISALSS